MEDKTTVRCWEDLANAVVLQAIGDYRSACRDLRRNPDSRSAEKRLRRLERFFRSRWCGILCSLDEPELKEIIFLKGE